MIDESNADPDDASDDHPDDGTADIDVATVQFAPTFGNAAANRDRTVAAIHEVGDAVDLVVLPELATSGYVFASHEEVRDLAEPRKGPSVAAWAEAAAATGAWVVGGFPERGADGTLYNAAAVVAPDGLVGVYRKTHLWNEEKRWFEPGDELPVFDAPFGRLGVQVCNDLWFPEATTTQARAGADLVALPTNWPATAGTERPGGWTRGAHLAVARASSNRVGLACADRTGTERGTTFEGQSLVVDADATVAAGPAPVDADATLTGTVDRASAREKALTAYDDVLGDRRPGLYDLE